MISFKILVWFFILLSTTGSALIHTLCTTPEYVNSCEQLNRMEDIKCVLEENPINCILMIENGNATLTRVSAEEAFLASSRTTNLVVLAEFIDKNSSPYTGSQYETVIVIRKDVEDGFKSLKASRYCHPGMDTTDVSPLILKQFAKEVLSQNKIDICSNNSNATLLELELKAYSNFFGPSCIPGKWSIVNNTLDLELKQKYTSLQELCQNNSVWENQNDPFLESLHCLSNEKGDLALTTLNAVNSYVNQYPSVLNDYALLCKNGTKVNITDGCSWTKQPWPLLLGNKKLIDNLSDELKNWFHSDLYLINEVPKEDSNVLNFPKKHIENLKKVIFPSNEYKINITSTRPNLGTYIKEFRTLPTIKKSRLCKFTARLCTISSKEQEKCMWLQQASLNYGIQPVIDCEQKTDKFECLKALQNNAVDFVVVTSDSTYSVNRKNLSIIAFGEESIEHMKRTVLVVRYRTIRSLSDLEHKKGCFAEYGDMSWLALVNTIKKYVWKDSDNYGKDLSNFLNDSCLPGVQDREREPYPIGINFNKLCEICEKTPSSPTYRSCNPDNTNDFFGNDGALKCLTHRGDFAVLALKRGVILPSKTTFMCKNGSLTNSNTLEIDNDCALSITINDEVVVRKFDSKNRDIELLLQELDERFAGQKHTAFKIFHVFGDEKDLLFKGTTIGMEMASESSNKYVKEQLDVFNNIPKYKESEEKKNGATSTSALFTTTILVFILNYFYL